MRDNLACNYLRVTSALQINKANSGHPGVCLGAAPIAFSIYKNAIFSPKNPNFLNRDRVVFSAGHSSALVYSILNLFGFDLSLNDLQNFRQFKSKTPGHPEVNITPGVDISTGPLGQGIANAVGFAIAEKYLNSYYKKNNFSPIDHFTYCFTGDGCLMEGVAQEAISLAGKLKLNKLILLYDKNDITIEGSLNLANTENVKNKFLACNWNVLQVKDGLSVQKIDKAILKAKKSNKPTVIIVKTQIGYGSSLVNTNKVHGKPLDNSQIDVLRQNLNYSVPDWQTPMQLNVYIDQLLEEKQKAINAYEDCLQQYKIKYPKEYKALLSSLNHKEINLSSLTKKVADKNFDCRQQLHEVLNTISSKIPELIGGSADVAPSTKAFISSSGYFSHENPTGKNIGFGIREHAMAAISNGISLHGGLKFFCSTFFAFANYMTPAIRMSAMMDVPVLYIFTHDSILVGEDGPTHQPVEQIATLRCLPGICVFRPCGRNELLACFEYYLNANKPTALLMGRQASDYVDDDFEKAKKGAYVILDSKNYHATIVATGSEVCLAIKASQALANFNINVRVVSAPCLELFENQTLSYKNKIIDKTKPVFCIEASADNVWYKYATNEEHVLKLNRFGMSAKASDTYSALGYSVDNIVKFIKKNI
ncbi:MAG: transketolase [Clostridia bacterium]|nr:transketolase [Clostridia bacterium]